MEAEGHFKNSAAERSIFSQRALVAAIGTLLLVALLISRLTWLQVFQHSYFDTRSDDNRMRLTVVPPVRGLIFDRNGVLMAENLPSYRLEIVPEQIEDMPALLDKLGKLIEIDTDDIELFNRRRDRTPPFRGVVLRNQLNAEEVARLEVNRHRFPGVDVRAALSRHYPLGNAAAHVIGYVGSITEQELEYLDERRYQGTQEIGKVGVEYSHEARLHGFPGVRIQETNAVGRSLRQLEYKRPQQGDSLYLTLDAKLQVAAELAMGEEDGAVVAIEPRTGGLLALVSRPNFDPGLFIHGIDHASFKALNENPGRPLYNRALQGQYPPGSTVKPMMALGGLELGLRAHHHREYCPGYFMLPNSKHRYRDWKRQGHGSVDMKYAITQSCDVYFYKLAIDMGVDRIHDFAARFGLGQLTGVDLPREKRGVLPSREWKRKHLNQPWYQGETVSVGIGQGYMTTTPMQLAHLAATIALRGERMRPRILLASEEGATGRIDTLPAVALEPVKLRSDEFWDWTIEAMEDVTSGSHGTARSVGRGTNYRVAGKTGTSQVIAMRQDEKYAVKNQDKPKHERDHALFIAFAPVEDPKIALAVLVEHGGGGGAVAAPIARKILDAYLEDKPVLPPEEEEAQP